MAASFETSIGVKGIWPDPPRYWSFSTLEDVAVCPRMYALKRASYPDLWNGRGYPERVNEAALVGIAIHEGVENVLQALHRVGCVTLAEEQAVEVIRSLGGYSLIARDALSRQLEKLDTNPRMVDQVSRIRQRLDYHSAEMRRAIQALVSQAPVSLVVDTSAKDRVPTGSQGVPLARGSHSEVTLNAREYRFIGTIDLLVVFPEHADIVDFKTGGHSDRHMRQLQLYGLFVVAG